MSQPHPSSAWLESPLQLLGALEAFAAGLLGERAVLSPRRDTPGIAAATGAARALHLPPGLTVADPTEELPALTDRRAVWAAGDVLSGRVQSALLRPLRAERLVLLDDGLATLRALEQLAAPRPTALVRPRGRVGPHRRVLGLATRARLRGLARQGRLDVFTVLPVPAATLDGLASAGVRVVRNDFRWLAGQHTSTRIGTRTAVVGSALPADGLVRPDAYVRWLEHLAEHEPLTYLPHRRTDAGVLSRIETHPGIRVERGLLPVEARLLHLRPEQRVLSLPSTALATLRVLLARTGTEVRGVPVPVSWWTDAASADLRAHLSTVLTEEDRA
ncbi:MAG: hypothetical protein GX593_13965 [Actinomycetales bacterium]|nr:hypothetical protein [Actinomycetales bacterium]